LVIVQIVFKKEKKIRTNNEHLQVFKPCARMKNPLRILNFERVRYYLENSTVFNLFQFPLVKSGISTGAELLLSEIAVSGPRQLHSAKS